MDKDKLKIKFQVISEIELEQTRGGTIYISPAPSLPIKTKSEFPPSKIVVPVIIPQVFVS